MAFGFSDAGLPWTEARLYPPFPHAYRGVEDLVVAAFNDAKAKADAASGAEMAKMTSGIPLPPGFKLPF
jgi:hypothetical protein